jgi:DNA-binding response OmpR family regulator
LKDNFEFKGYAVQTAADGERGLEAALDGRPDLIVLDIMLPKINGYEVCRLIRREGLDVPIIMLTAKGQEEDIILGLNLGADDYVTKPFSIQELLARANAFLRRRREEESQVHRFGDCELDVASRRLTREGVRPARHPGKASRPRPDARADTAFGLGLRHVRRPPERGSLRHHPAQKSRAQPGPSHVHPDHPPHWIPLRSLP